jgi:isoleucyl-tRNA synthetase
MTAPFTPFIAEALYQGMLRSAESKPCPTIHALDWPTAETVWLDDVLERDIEVCQRVVSAAAMARMKAGLKLRQPVKSITVVTREPVVSEALLKMKPLLLEQMNARSVDVSSTAESEPTARVRAIPNMAAIGREFKSRAGKLAEKLSSMDHAQLRSALAKGPVEVEVDSEKLKVDNRHLTFVEETSDTQPAADFVGGRILIDTALSEEEALDGLARDLVRRIQQMRKEMDLRVDAFVEVDVASSSDEAVSSVERREGYISGEVRAKKMTVQHADPPKARGEFVRDWQVGGETFSIGLTQQKALKRPTHATRPRRTKKRLVRRRRRS